MTVDALVRTLRRDGISDERVLQAIRSVPREAFVERRLRSEAWANHPLPIGHGQTISQPYVVARMTELLALERGDRVLEVGTGCGYQTAVLVWLGAEVYSVERVAGLAARAAHTLQELELEPAGLRQGDGWQGWPEQAPFDAIIVTASPSSVPAALIDQLAPEGRLVIPVGPREAQRLLRLVREPGGGIRREDHGGVRFVPLVPDADSEALAER